MPRFVVLLRGVNVGKANRVHMAEFKAMLESLGYTQVKTLLNSGNAVFASAGRATEKHAKSIAASLQEKFAVATPVVVKSEVEFKAAVTGNLSAPPEAEWSRFLVAFGPDKAVLQALEPLRSLARKPESFAIGTAAAYLHCPEGLLASKAAESMLGKAGRGVTTRNWATVLKLEALLSAA
ncbi:MAG: DUF1697 domain-containing protein [Burkholderiaceae bacterium]|nr:DUF1697 domain-containing protein [Burkholderiaceae bacterium]